MLKFIFILLLSFCSATLAESTPEKLPGNIAVHIAKVYYEHPMRLTDPYSDVWHMKGPLAEAAALETLEKHFANIGTCATSNNADVVLLLEPHMFYNTRLTAFYAEFIARVFTNSTEPITSIKKQAQQSGRIDIKPEYYMEKGYAKAMEKVIKKLKTDKAFLAALDKSGQAHAESLCETLDDLPPEKIYY